MLDKVYVVLAGVYYEDTYIAGVYKDKEQAEQEKQRIEQFGDDDWAMIEEHTIE